MIHTKCLKCQKKITTYLSRIKDGKGKYCSRKCKDKDMKGEYTNCLNCNIKIYYTPCKKRKYCSKKCFYKQNNGINNPNWKGGKIERKCETCEKKFKCWEDQKRKYCSHRCSRLGKDAWNKGVKCPQLAGKNNPNWKGGLTDMGSRIRTCLEYKNWRKSVFERDNYLCVIGKEDHGNKLHVDHIKPFSIIIQQNNIKTLEDALNCRELWNINNGQTLCVDCHKKTKTYLNKHIT